MTGAALDGSSVPTITQACNAIQAAEALINGYLHLSSAYTTVPNPVAAIALKVTLNILAVRQWWEITQGAISDIDLMGSANYPPDLMARIMTDEIKEELDAWKKHEDFYLSGQVGLIVATTQDSDLSFDRDDYV